MNTPASESRRGTAAIILATAAALLLWIARPHPVQASRAQKKQGQLLYRSAGCEHCHAADLRGGDLGPDISTIGKQWAKPQIEHQIVHGGGGMPPFADTLQPDEITALVEFLHAQRKAPKGPKPTAPTAPKPEPGS